MKKQFNITDYETGKYDVVTRDGRPVEILSVYGRGLSPVKAYVSSSNGLDNFNTKGEWIPNRESGPDLFLIEKVTSFTQYMNIYKTYITRSGYSRYEANETCDKDRTGIAVLEVFSNGEVKLLESILL